MILKLVVIFFIILCLYSMLKSDCGCNGFTPGTFTKWTDRNTPVKRCLNNCQGNRYREYLPCMYNCLSNDTFRKHYYLH